MTTKVQARIFGRFPEAKDPQSMKRLPPDEWIMELNAFTDETFRIVGQETLRHYYSPFSKHSVRVIISWLIETRLPHTTSWYAVKKPENELAAFKEGFKQMKEAQP